jgi:DNA polymerase-1
MTDQRFSFYSQEQSAVLIARLREQQEQNFAYLEIEGEQDLEVWVAKIEQESCFIALDTETKGLIPAPGMVRTVQIAYSQDVPVLVIKLSKIKNHSSLQRLLANPKLLKIGHHLKFDILMLAAEGIEVKPPVMCTLLGFEVLKAGATKQASLQFVAQELLNVKLDKAQQHSHWTGKLTPTQLQYAANDAGILVKLLPELQSRLALANLSQIAILEYYCLLPLAQMQSRGIYLDFQRWQKVRQDYELKRENLAEEIYQELGQRFNIASPKQLLKVLQQQVEIDEVQAGSVVLRRSILDSTNSNILIERVKDYPILAKILKYRSLNTTINTFLKGFEEYVESDNRLRGNWWQIGTRTGRTSCHEPNLSNIPKIPQIRHCFTATEGYLLIDADYSQIELRLAAKRMNVPTLIEAFQRGDDIHALTASYIYDCEVEELKPEQRKLGKILNLGLIYGMGAEKFRLNAAKKFGTYLTLERAKELRGLFFDFYPEIEDYHQRCRRNWQQGQQRSSSSLGRVNIWSQKKPKLNQIINYPIQADCADILKRAISSWHQKSSHQNLDAYLVMTAYDQLVIEVREDLAQDAAQILEQVMMEAGQDLLTPVPIVVDVKVGKYWS